MSALLKIPPEQVVGHLLRVWIWADQQSTNVDDGVDAYVDAELSTVDVIAHLEGCAEAMQKVGWLKMIDGRVTFPHLQSFISETAKIRALRNRRQTKWRSNVDQSVSTNVDRAPSTKTTAREEKSYTPLPPASGGHAHKERSANRRAKSNGNGRSRSTPLSDDAVKALGIRYEMPAQAGESMEQYRGRVMAEDRRRHDE